MKLFKKALGVLLVVAMLMSVCAAMFTNVATAYTVTDNNVLVLTFDDEKGIADYRAKSGVFDFSFEEGVQVDGTTGKYPVFTHKSYQGWSVVFGNEDSVAAVSQSSAAHPNRFTVSEAGTYTFTYSYKYLAGASQPNFTKDIVANETFSVDFYKCAVAHHTPTNGLPGKAGIGAKGTLKVSSLTEGVDYKLVDDIAAVGATEYQRVELIKDTQWFTTSFDITFSEADITAGRTSICMTMSAGDSNLVGDGQSDVEFKLAIDNVNISHAGAAEAATSAKTYVYDFKDAAGNPMDTSSFGGHSNFSGSEATGGSAKGAKIDVDGMHYCLENSNFPTDGYNWAYKAYLKDPDFRLGNDTSGKDFLRIEANTTYYISMKFKLGTIASGVNNARVGIGLTTGTEAGTVTVGTASSTSTTVNVGDTDWHTVSVVIDSDTAFVKTTDTSNVGKYVCIMGAANVGDKDAEMIVDNVTVTVVDKSTPVSQATSVLADFDKGLNEIYLPQGNALNNGTYTIIPDPLNSGRGNVLQFACTFDSTANFGMPAVSEMGGFKIGGLSSGYTVTPGRTYRVSYDVYLKTAISASSAYLFGVGGFANYLCKVNGIGNAGNKSGNLIEKVTFERDGKDAANRHWRTSYITGQWVNITYEYTPDDTATNYPYIVIAFSCSNNAVYCFDNVSITDVTDKDTANGTVILDTQRGTMDADATVTLPVGSIYEMPTPTREGYVFAGWTQNWDLANDMTYSWATSVQSTVTISADNAPRTVLAVEPGFTRYYAIWVSAKTYNFNDLTDKYLGSTFGQTSSGEFSSGDFYGEDLDGDGDYDAIGLDKAAKGPNQYSINLGETKTVVNVTYYDMFTLHEGVTYKITFNKKIDKLSTTKNKATIGLTRGSKQGYGNVPIGGSSSYSWDLVADFTAAEDAYSEYTHEFKVFGMFNTSYNGGADAAGVSRTYKDGLHVIVGNGSILFDSITIEPISYDDGRVQINGENIEGVEANIDYENKTVTVSSTLASTINSKSVRVFNNYYYGTADYEVSKLAYNKYGQAECTSISAGSFSYANNTELLTVADPMTIRVIVDVIPETVKRSIRAEGMVGGKYQSAGLRFRYTLTDAQVAGATEIGFIASPDASQVDWYKNVDGTTVKKAVVFDGTNDIVYKVNEGSKDYQLIITNLTKEGVEKNAKDLTINVVMYVTTGTDTTYYFVRSSSYNDVKNAYSNNSIVADDNGNAY